MIFRFLIFFTFLYGSYPYEYFKNILDIAKLQAPTSHYNPNFSRHYGEFKNYSNKYFYLKNKNLVFFMCGKHNRSELRFKNTWFIPNNKSIEIETKILPLKKIKEFTFLQIHSYPKNSKNHINKPLLRIVWRKNYKHKKNSIWAIIKTNSGYLKIFIDKKPNNFFDLKVKVRNSRLIIFYNKKEKINLDISYWKNISNYFKVGVYLQTKGCAKAIFKKIIVKQLLLKKLKNKIE